jgi:hypothetical protein
MPGLKKNLNLLVNYDPSNGVIQPEQLLQEVRMRHIQVGLFLATIVLSLPTYSPPITRRGSGYR